MRPNHPEAESTLDLPVSQNRVWRQLTEEAGLAKWMGPGSTIEVKVGGRVDVNDVVGGGRRLGRVDQVDEGRSLTFSWWPETKPLERSQVTIRLEPDIPETGTRITVTESVPQRLAPTSITAYSQRRAGVGPVSAMMLWPWRLAVLAVAGTMATV